MASATLLFRPRNLYNINHIYNSNSNGNNNESNDADCYPLRTINTACIDHEERKTPANASVFSFDFDSFVNDDEGGEHSSNNNNNRDGKIVDGLFLRSSRSLLQYNPEDYSSNNDDDDNDFYDTPPSTSTLPKVPATFISSIKHPYRPSMRSGTSSCYYYEHEIIERIIETSSEIITNEIIDRNGKDCLFLSTLTRCAKATALVRSLTWNITNATLELARCPSPSNNDNYENITKTSVDRPILGSRKTTCTKTNKVKDYLDDCDNDKNGVEDDQNKVFRDEIDSLSKTIVTTTSSVVIRLLQKHFGKHIGKLFVSTTTTTMTTTTTTTAATMATTTTTATSSTTSATDESLSPLNRQRQHSNSTTTSSLSCSIGNTKLSVRFADEFYQDQQRQDEDDVTLSNNSIKPTITKQSSSSRLLLSFLCTYYTIPNREDYTIHERQLVWMNRDEMKYNSIRNYKEYEYERYHYNGYVLEEDDFCYYEHRYIHPAHFPVRIYSNSHPCSLYVQSNPIRMLKEHQHDQQKQYSIQQQQLKEQWKHQWQQQYWHQQQQYLQQHQQQQQSQAQAQQQHVQQHQQEQCPLQW